MTPHYTSGEYVITGIPNAFDKRTSYWISKKGNTDAYYCFTATGKEVMGQLANFAAYIALYELKHNKANAREFDIKTPKGILHVTAKHEIDNDSDYPGVYIELKDTPAVDNNDGCLCCVEYDSSNDRIQTCVYQLGVDEPVEIVHHELDDEE